MRIEKPEHVLAHADSAAHPGRAPARKATIDLSGIGLAVTELELVKYIDGRWYFNEL